MKLFLTVSLVAHLVVHRAPSSWAERWFLVDGPDFRAVSRAYFARQRHDGGCVSVEQKRYARERVVVYICNV